MPIVFVQHLSPEHESLIPSLLQGTTHLRAVQAKEGISISPEQSTSSRRTTACRSKAGLKLHPRPAGRAVSARSTCSSVRSPTMPGTARLASCSQARRRTGLRASRRSSPSAGSRSRRSPRRQSTTGCRGRRSRPARSTWSLAHRNGERAPRPLPSSLPRATKRGAARPGRSPMRCFLRSSGLLERPPESISQYKTATIKRRLQRRMMIHRMTEIEATSRC